METLPEGKRKAVEQTMRDFEQFFSLQGHLVLEIGSQRNAAAERLLDMGAQSVICSNIVKDAQIVQSDKISYVRTDARDTGFGPASFDVVFGRAILEHITDIYRLHDEITRILKPGGVFYLDGGPMWYSPRGHHLGLRAPSGHMYHFSNDDCPVQDWEHLLLSEEEMVRVLQDRHVDERDVQSIVHCVYHGKGINRLPTSAVCKAFEEDPILDVVIIMNASPKSPPEGLVGEYGATELTTKRVVIAGQKKTSADEPDVFSQMLNGTAEETSTHALSSRAQETVPLPTHSRAPAARHWFTGFRSMPGHFYWRMRHRVAEHIVRRHPGLARLYRRLRYGRS